MYQYNYRQKKLIKVIQQEVSLTFSGLARYKIDADGNVTPGLLTTDQGRNPAEYEQYLYETSNVDLANTVLTQMKALRDNATMHNVDFQLDWHNDRGCINEAYSNDYTRSYYRNFIGDYWIFGIYQQSVCGNE